MTPSSHFVGASRFSTMELFISETEGWSDLAFVSGYTTRRAEDGERVLNGRYLDIRKRQQDGFWLFYRDLVNIDRTAERQLTAPPNTRFQLTGAIVW